MVDDQGFLVRVVIRWVGLPRLYACRTQLLQRACRRHVALAKRMRLQQHAHVYATARGVFEGVHDRAVGEDVDLDLDRHCRPGDGLHNRRLTRLRLDEDAHLPRGA
jgi:hypothetical protein